MASEAAEQNVLGSIPGSDKLLLTVSIRIFLVAVTQSGFVPVYGNSCLLHEIKNFTDEIGGVWNKVTSV